MSRKKRNRRFRAVLFHTLLLPVVLAHPLRAQDGEARYSFVFSGTAVSEALNRLIDETDINLIFESQVVAGASTFCKANRLPIREILQCILRDTGLDYVLLSSGTYTIVRSARGASSLGTIKGSVLDQESGEPIEDAHILLLTANVGTASNRSGRFVFTKLNPGPHLVSVSHISYGQRRDTVFVSSNGEEELLVLMKKQSLLADALVITGAGNRRSRLRRGADVIQNVELLDLNALASVNILQTLDLVEGMYAGGSLSSIHMQGSDSGEHAYKLDGVTVFIPVRLGGLIGPFSPFAVEDIHIHKAGYGASYGSQLAGVVDITHQIAPASRRRAEVLIDPISINARVSGRSGSGSGIKASWMIAARQDLQSSPYYRRIDDIMQSWSKPDFFLLDRLRNQAGLEPLDDDTKNRLANVRDDFNVGFSDVHAAGRVNLGLFHTVQASLYRNRNLFGENLDNLGLTAPDGSSSEDRFKWENTTFQVRYEGTLTSRLFTDVALWHTDYRLRDTFGGFPLGLTTDELCDFLCSGQVLKDDFNEVAESGVTMSFRYAASLRHTLASSLEVIKSENDFTISLSPFLDAVSASESRQPNSWRLGGFLEDTWSFSPSTQLRTGLRLTYLPEQETVYAEPRIALESQVPERSRGIVGAGLSAGLYRQFLHQVDVTTYNTNALFPSVRFWFPLEKSERPPKALHVSGNLVLKPAPQWTISLDSYYKHQPYLLVLNYGDFLSLDETSSANNGARDVRDISLLTRASGRAYGVSLAVNHHAKRHNLLVRYEYSNAERRIRNRFDNRSMSTPWNVPHAVFALLEVVPADAIVLSLRAQRFIGRAWAFRSAYYDYLEPSLISAPFGIYDLAQPESHKTDDFFQVDAGITYTSRLGAMDLQIRLHALNLLGTENVRDWGLQESGSSGIFSTVTRPGIPFMPMFSIRLGV